ncbi:MAG TPA: HepT-like ribonuclease domain-containing protein [Rhodopila sp.]|jgi:uncharacterized protein with HEPN domain|nr:HepT-like ribonuclease domain-containing protein [Rhodopila sp.]
MSAPGRTPDYLWHMLDATIWIEVYLAGFDQDGFNRDNRTQDAIIRNLEIIGEAARNVVRDDPTFASGHPEIPWAQAYRMRNILSHAYAEVDVGIVWNAAQHDIPVLREKLRLLISSLGW